MKDIILFGGGGHCKSVIDTLKQLNDFNIIGILDLKEKVGLKVNGVKVVGEDKDLLYYFGQGVKYGFVTLGSVGNTKGRKELYQQAANIGFDFPIIIDNTAIVSESAKIKNGSFIGKGSIINTNGVVGSNSIVNTGAIIDHDSVVGDYCHLAPGTTVSGGVQIGDNTHIGTNSTIIENINIGTNTIIGAGSVVVKDINSNKKAYGNPCKEA